MHVLHEVQLGGGTVLMMGLHQPHRSQTGFPVGAEVGCAKTGAVATSNEKKQTVTKASIFPGITFSVANAYPISRETYEGNRV